MVSFSECAEGCEIQCRSYCKDIPLDRCRCFIGCMEACMPGDAEWEEE
jgi:hypothetical protein